MVLLFPRPLFKSQMSKAVPLVSAAHHRVKQRKHLCDRRAGGPPGLQARALPSLAVAWAALDRGLLLWPQLSVPGGQAWEGRKE